MESQTRAPRVLGPAPQSPAPHRARVPRRVRQPLAAPATLNQTWALDFVADMLYDGRRIRALTVIDEGNREGLEIAIGISLPSRRVVRVLEDLVLVHGAPAAVRVDNGPEFIAQPFVDWAAEHRVAIHYIQPDKPDQNAYIERFNRSYRTEVLNAHLFESTAELQELTDTWLRIYNRERPTTALPSRSPPGVRPIRPAGPPCDRWRVGSPHPLRAPRRVSRSGCRPTADAPASSSCPRSAGRASAAA